MQLVHQPKIEIWGDKNFFAGYNKLAVVLYDSLDLTGKITNAHIHLMPVMTMKMGNMDMQQSTPVENPDELSNKWSLSRRNCICYAIGCY